MDKSGCFPGLVERVRSWIAENPISGCEVGAWPVRRVKDDEMRLHTDEREAQRPAFDVALNTPHHRYLLPREGRNASLADILNVVARFAGSGPLLDCQAGNAVLPDPHLGIRRRMREIVGRLQSRMTNAAHDAEQKDEGTRGGSH